MKLLLIFILFLLFCLLGSGMNRVWGRDIAMAEKSSEQPESLFSNISEIEVDDYLRANVFIRNILSPIKQLDLPEDHGHSYHLSAKILYHSNKSVLTARNQTFYSQKFMRLLSARHINGFYIYSLRKLII